MNSKQKFFFIVIPVISFVAGILVMYGIVIYRTNRPLEPLLDFLKQPFPAYKDSTIIDVRPAHEGYGGGRYRDSLGLKRYKYLHFTEIQLDITNIPNVHAKNLCLYYLNYLESSGLLTPMGALNPGYLDDDYYFYPDNNSLKPMINVPINIGRAYRGYAYSHQGFIKIVCIIADYDGENILTVPPEQRVTDEKDSYDLQGRRIALIRIQLQENGFTTTGGLLKD